MGPRKMLEGCQLEKEGLFPTGHPGRSTGSNSNMTRPFEPTLVHLKVQLLVSHYGDTFALSSEWLEGVLLMNTLLENPLKGFLDKAMPPHLLISDPLITIWKGCYSGTPFLNTLGREFKSR